MVILFVNQSSHSLIISCGDRTAYLNRGDQQSVQLKQDDIIRFEIKKKSRIKTSFFMLWAGAIVTENTRLQIVCDSILKEIKNGFEPIVYIRDNSARVFNICYDALSFRDQNDVPIDVEYQIHNFCQLRRKYKLFLWLLGGFPLAILGVLCLLKSFSWSLLFAIAFLMVLGIMIPVKALKKLDSKCSSETANYLLNLSIEDKIHHLVFDDNE